MEYEAAELILEGARLHYVSAGEGEPVVLLHGYPQSHLCWRHQIPALAKTHRVIAPDWLGWGESERSTEIVPEYWAEVGRLDGLLDALGLDSANVLAHDYGGFLALGLAIKYPERVKRLAVLNSRAHRTFTPLFYMQTALQSWMARHTVTRTLLESAPVGFLHRLQLNRYVEKGCFPSELLQRYIGWMDYPEGRRWYAHFYAHYELPPRRELSEGLAGIRCATQVIWGDADPYCPIDIGEGLASRIPGAGFTRIEGADHFVMEECPDVVSRVLGELLARPADAAAGRAA